MALQYLARKVRIPAIRRALGLWPSPSAGHGRLASRPSQAGYSKGAEVDGVSKMETHAEMNGLKTKVEEETASLKALCKETRKKLKDAIALKKLERRCYIGSIVAGVAAAMYLSVPGITQELQRMPPEE
ncbi:hypothetical protein EJB05_49106 [Eragrostis curvula]|uniref:Uncharacterized protein n=1 Tax=Eragrostis curvula TaxID=38414 RepID=A0A5J9T3I2_9POAL|nr:hypothetical protein EJB05_49105 [Eragrostis curvula]TVU05921.1 hypothetical protein EJB05_49106 [Eragrostis curvula]